MFWERYFSLVLAAFNAPFMLRLMPVSGDNPATSRLSYLASTRPMIWMLAMEQRERPNGSALKSTLQKHAQRVSPTSSLMLTPCLHTSPMPPMLLVVTRSSPNAGYCRSDTW
jgi:hypothetical protein